MGPDTRLEAHRVIMLARVWCALILLVLGSPTFGHAAVTHAFLVQNSGWMEPFYADPASPFKPLVKAVIETIPDVQSQVIVASFNQSVGTQRSPIVLYRGDDRRSAANAVDAIIPARKQGSSAYADTDFREALTAIVTEHLQGEPAVIWIFTNNKNSPGNDADTAARNREFYELLHVEPAVTRTLAFPLAMPVKGKQYAAKGLMVYALAYGKAAGAALEHLVAAGGATQVFTDAPARLKPLDRDAVAFVPHAVPEGSGVRASLAADGRSLMLWVDAGMHPKEVAVQGAFRNEFFPYAIRSGVLSASLKSGDWSGELDIAPARLDRALDPGDSLGVVVRLPIPSAQIPTLWSLEALGKMGMDYHIDAALEIAMAEQTLAISSAFVERMRTVFPGDPMPEQFKPAAEVRASTATIPVRIVISYPIYPLLALVGVAALVLGLIAAGLFLAAKERRYEVILNGQSRKVVVKAFRQVELRSPEGAHIATLKRGLGKPGVAWLAQGASVQVKA